MERMERTQLSENGQVIIPEVIRRALHWNAGQELVIVNTGDGVLLKSKKLFEPAAIDDVAGCLKYSGAAKTIDEMNEAIAEGIRQRYANRT